MQQSKKIVLTFAMLVLGAFTANAQIFVTVRPFRPVVVRTVAPSPRHIWVDEDWVERDGRYVWVGGHWENPRDGYRYNRGYWRKGDRGDYWVPGHWNNGVRYRGGPSGHHDNGHHYGHRKHGR